MSAERLPLYLGARAAVRLDDGPSLVLSAEGLAGSRVPLDRISRLIAPVGCGLDEEVLLACARRGIPVLWQERDGTPLAWLVTPGRPPRLGWRERMAGAVARSDWPARYGIWRSAQLAMARRVQEERLEGFSFGAALARGSYGCGVPGEAASTGAAAQDWARHTREDGSDPWLDALLRRTAIPLWLGRCAIGRWRGCALLLLAEHWQAIGVDAAAMVWTARRVNIGADMARCLALGMLEPGFRRKSSLRLWRRIALHDCAAVQHTAVTLFEHHKVAMLHLAAALHDRFHRWLLELESCR
ncbi:MAG: hypothetical protein D6682_06190 [Zetaproteobacteria bacterium]|nr:MAG: hypothetical protein D6682_06190 [Zetaproteobacteria bacterium]